jgi:sodium-dependent dicarboxylate transporter 2/3/5
MQGLLVAVALSCSLAMSLPISTPPNALAYSTGFVKTKDMAKMGVSVGIVGIIYLSGCCSFLVAQAILKMKKQLLKRYPAVITEVVAKQEVSKKLLLLLLQFQFNS